MSALPATTPSAAPASAGTSACARYARTTWFGVNPSALRMPIRRVPVPTAPAITLPTMSTAITTPSTPNATRNGTSSAVLLALSARVVSQERAAVSAPAGRAACTAARPASTCAALSAAARR
nr:hypothetical protein GCM10020092_065510 [Actinoplanes digitatis]